MKKFRDKLNQATTLQDHKWSTKFSDMAGAVDRLETNMVQPAKAQDVTRHTVDNSATMCESLVLHVNELETEKAVVSPKIQSQVCLK